MNIIDLEPGMDFRETKYRRNVFLRFYDFHIKYKSHPGGVYYFFPYISKKLGFDMEDKLWFAFINGNTQNPVTSYVIRKNFPSLYELDLDKLDEWFNSNWKSLEFDIDRKYQKKDFAKSVEKYREQVLKYDTQENMYNEIMKSGKYSNFMNIWNFIRKHLYTFGRLSTFSYSEYLNIMGIKFECDNVFLEDISGSMSHRNGLLKVLGRDDLEMWDENPNSPSGYTKEQISWLGNEMKSLLDDAKEFSKNNRNYSDISYYTLESALCTYKGWHRKNRRYPNVYNDMAYLRIRRGEKYWKDDLSIFWDARKEYLPDYLRVETNPSDPIVVKNKLCRKKQNHYRETGEVIMMENDWECFKNNYVNDGVIK